MEGVSILITDFNEGACLALLELFSEKNAIPFVLAKDFETIHEIYANFTSAIPIVLDAQQNIESTINHLTVLPTMSCIFNFEGEKFEELHRKHFDHFVRSINIYKADFDISDVIPDILEAVSDGYTLIVNLVNFPLPTATNQLLAKIEKGEAEAPPADPSNVKSLLQKVLHKSPPKPKCPALANERAELSLSIYPCRHSANLRSINPITMIMRRIFVGFIPCSGMCMVNLASRSSSRRVSIKSPAEINKYIRIQQSSEIRSAFETIHGAALRNWISRCKESSNFTKPYEGPFKKECKEIRRQGEEGRKSLLDKINMELDKAKEWDHVLGERALEKLKVSREHEVELKVQQFCIRKISEARERFDKEILQLKMKTKNSFYNDILGEQITALMLIQEKFEKRAKLLKLPYTGELGAK